MEEITITGDTTRIALQNVINKAIQKFGKELKIIISNNLQVIKK